jgi:plastocyanin
VKVLLLAAAIVLFGGASARADNPTLTGTVGTGDSFTISLSQRSVAPGTYTLLVHDRSAIHNFHFFGPGGVDVSTTIEDVGDQSFTVTLVAGTYTYICDAHPSMKGTLTVGAAQPQAKPKPKKKKKMK